MDDQARRAADAFNALNAIEAEENAAELAKYTTLFVPIDEINPSPENDDIYGAIEMDEPMEQLIASVEKRGLEEPIILTEDHFILSGHRRYFALKHLGWNMVPARIKRGIRRADNRGFHRDLAEYNPQRIKKTATLLKEALLRDTAADTYASIKERDRAAIETTAEYMIVQGTKDVKPVSASKQEFLKAVQEVINGDLREFWPLSVRQIHYGLLNNPPLTLTPKRSKYPTEHYRYKQDDESYDKLITLLTAGRYHGDIPMNCIDDPTRPQITFGGFESVHEFVEQELRLFLTGFHRNRQQGQKRYVEVFAEKNTLLTIAKQICQKYYVPLNVGRGFCSTPVWRDIAARYRQSGCERMTLIIISDYDPAGLALADDAMRTLKDLWDLPVDGHRVAVTREQIDELELAADYNPAKPSDTNYKNFTETTGGDKCWEVEALPPRYLQERLASAIEANLDMELFESICDEEKINCGELQQIRDEMVTDLSL